MLRTTVMQVDARFMLPGAFLNEKSFRARQAVLKSIEFTCILNGGYTKGTCTSRNLRDPNHVCCIYCFPVYITHISNYLLYKLIKPS